jgi:hypothetical protein
MQEGQVGWDPMYETRMPWEARLFVFYLALVLFFAILRPSGCMCFGQETSGQQ